MAGPKSQCAGRELAAQENVVEALECPAGSTPKRLAQMRDCAMDTRIGFESACVIELSAPAAEQRASEPLPDALNKLGGGDTERLGNVEQSLVQDSAPTVLNIHENVARNAREHSELFESEPAVDPVFVNLEADLPTATFPCSDPFRVVLTRTRRHAL